MKDNQRIDILKQILLKLHEGASPESVQAEFDQHFTGVSAIEISMMEHELMNGDHGITFEDVMKLCNVHAQLFKNAVEGVESAEIEKAGHPVQVFKEENLALRATLLRIHRILTSLQTSENFDAGLLKGLKRQFDLLGQFDHHYRRKEELFFPIMEAYGHDAPPKVMWGVDDQIRDLFQQAYQALMHLVEPVLEPLISAFDLFEQEFKEMIFKEEAILLPLLLSIFNEDDWLKVARDSDEFGYAIIKPSAQWQPQRQDFHSNQVQIADLPTDKAQLAFGGGYLTLQEANLILNNLPLEITFIDKDDIFKYFNESFAMSDKIFPRAATAIGRHVENCHPPKSLDMVRTLIADLKSGKRDSESMWFHMTRKQKYVYVTYKAVRDAAGHYLGVLEYVQDIQPFFELGEDKRGLSGYDLPSSPQ